MYLFYSNQTEVEVMNRGLDNFVAIPINETVEKIKWDMSRSSFVNIYPPLKSEGGIFLYSLKIIKNKRMVNKVELL